MGGLCRIQLLFFPYFTRSGLEGPLSSVPLGSVRTLQAAYGQEPFFSSIRWLCIMVFDPCSVSPPFGSGLILLAD